MNQQQIGTSAHEEEDVQDLAKQEVCTSAHEGEDDPMDGVLSQKVVSKEVVSKGVVLKVLLGSSEDDYPMVGPLTKEVLLEKVSSGSSEDDDPMVARVSTEVVMKLSSGSSEDVPMVGPVSKEVSSGYDPMQVSERLETKNLSSHSSEDEREDDVKLRVSTEVVMKLSSGSSEDDPMVGPVSKEVSTGYDPMPVSERLETKNLSSHSSEDEREDDVKSNMSMSDLSTDDTVETVQPKEFAENEETFDHIVVNRKKPLSTPFTGNLTDSLNFLQTTNQPSSDSYSSVDVADLFEPRRSSRNAVGKKKRSAPMAAPPKLLNIKKPPVKKVPIFLQASA
jgi:hypothetical protein